MPIQIIDQGPSAGGRLGEALGKGLGGGFSEQFGKGLERFAQQKFDQMEEDAFYNKFLGMGYDPNSARLFAMRRKSPKLDTLIQSLIHPEQQGNQNPLSSSGLVQQQQQGPQREYSLAESMENGVPQEQGQMQQQQMNQPMQPQQAQQQGPRPPQFKQKQNPEMERLNREIDDSYQPMIADRMKSEPIYNDMLRTAESMLKNVEKNKDKWPNQYEGLLPEAYFTDKDIRKYISDGTRLFTLQAGMTKGNTTNRKLQLAERAKANLSQPYETQVEILKDVIAGAKAEKEISTMIPVWRSKNGGHYPVDMLSRMEEIRNKYESEESTSGTPAPSSKIKSVAQSDIKNIPLGKKARNKKTGEILVWDGSDFVPEKKK